MSGTIEQFQIANDKCQINWKSLEFFLELFSMPVTASAKKALRRDRRRTAVNLTIRSQIRTLRIQALQEPSPEHVAAVFSVIDRAAKKQVIHKNKAARLKSRLSALIRRKR